MRGNSPTSADVHVAHWRICGDISRKFHLKCASPTRASLHGGMCAATALRWWIHPTSSIAGGQRLSECTFCAVPSMLAAQSFRRTSSSSTVAGNRASKLRAAYSLETAWCSTAASVAAARHHAEPPQRQRQRLKCLKGSTGHPDERLVTGRNLTKRSLASHVGRFRNLRGAASWRSLRHIKRDRRSLAVLR